MKNARSIDISMRRLLGAAAVGAVAVTGFGLADATLGTPAAHAADIPLSGDQSAYGAEFTAAYEDARAGGESHEGALHRAIEQLSSTSGPVAFTKIGAGYDVLGAHRWNTVELDGQEYTVHDLRWGGTFVTPADGASTADGWVAGGLVSAGAEDNVYTVTNPATRG